MTQDPSVGLVVLALMLLPLALLGIGVWIGLKLINRKPKK
jgi:hypothetical protein